jgi:hypothetical protein
LRCGPRYSEFPIVIAFGLPGIVPPAGPQICVVLEEAR